jgi:hypothetical protein
MKFGGRAFFSMFFFALPAIAHADLVDRGLQTYDSQSGLEWLDLSQTRGLSFDAVCAQLGAGGSYAGYRYATTLEAQTLLGEFGLPIVSYTTYATDIWAPNLANFDALLGLNVGGLGPAYGFQAETGDLAGAGYHLLLYGSAASMNTALNADSDDAIAAGDRLISRSAEVTVGYAASYSDRNLSHFLVRKAEPVTSVPEPGTYALMLVGLMGVGLVSRRKAS